MKRARVMLCVAFVYFFRVVSSVEKVSKLHDWFATVYRMMT